MLYSMQMLPAACWGGTMGDVGERTAKPKNMNVRISIWRSLRSAENTTTTCSQCSLSSAASRSETKASRDPSGSMHGGNATKSVLPRSTASHWAARVRNVSRNGGGAPLVCPGASGPPQRPCTQRHGRGVRGHDTLGTSLLLLCTQHLKFTIVFHKYRHGFKEIMAAVKTVRYITFRTICC